MKRSFPTTIRAANADLIADTKVDTIGMYFSPDYVTHIGSRDITGHGAIRGYLALLHGAFADLRVDVEILLEGEERVAWQRTVRGTHRGTFQGFPATGREVVWHDMITSRFHAGLIAEEWAVSDLAEQLLRARKG